MFYPTAYIMTKLRKVSASSTIKVHAYTIKKLYRWAESAGIDIHSRLETKEYFKPFEYEQLVNYLSKKFSDKFNNAVDNNKASEYLKQASSYLTWYAKQVIGDSLSPEAKSAIENIESSINERASKKNSSYRSDTARPYKKLNDTIKNALHDFIDNRIPENDKPSIESTDYRTATMLQIYYETGCRESEALVLQLRHFTRAIGGNPATLYFERTHDNPKDHRKNEPVVKTEARYYPISDKTALMIETYLSKHREIVPNVSFDDDSHIFVTHLAGRNQGKALNISAFDSVLARLKKRLPKLRGLHCHLLRHNWNYDYSESTRERGLNEKQKEANRLYLMGWVPHSRMTSVYDHAFLVESAHESAAELNRTRKHSSKQPNS